MEVDLREQAGMRVAAWSFSGPYGGLAQVVGEATAWLRANKEPGGALTTVFLDEASLMPTLAEHDVPQDGHAHGPDEGHPVRAEVWAPVSDALAAKEETAGPRLRNVPAVRAAIVEREGDPRELLAIAAALRRFLAREGYALSAETRIVHTMPAWDALDEWRAELQVPVTGKS